MPDRSQFVIIVAPHTSNWDFFVGLAAAFAMDLDAHWIGKHTLFRWPVGSILRRLGGIPVNRNLTRGLVAQVVDRFESHPDFVLAIAPEGTRSRVDKWKSGFYHIAHGADVPILPTYFDYAKREIGFLPPFTPSGDVDLEVPRLRAAFASVQGRLRTAAGG